MLLRLETMVLSAEEIPLSAIRRKLASALDVVVHLGRLRDKSRRVLEITEVVGYEGDEIMLNPLFQFEDTGESRGQVQGRLMRINRLLRVDKLQLAGCMEAYEKVTERDDCLAEEGRKYGSEQEEGSVDRGDPGGGDRLDPCGVALLYPDPGTDPGGSGRLLCGIRI